MLTLNILLYEKKIVDGNVIGEVDRRNVQKYENTVWLLEYNNHIFYVNNIDAVFQYFRCPNWDYFCNGTFIVERNLIKCSERVNNVFPKNVYQTQETLFDKLDYFGIEYTNEQTLFENLVFFNLDSICAQTESFKDTDTTRWIGKHIPI